MEEPDTADNAVEEPNIVVPKIKVIKISELTGTLNFVFTFPKYDFSNGRPPALEKYHTKLDAEHP